MKQYNLSKAIDKGRLLSKIYDELLKLREIISKIQRELENKQQQQKLGFCAHIVFDSHSHVITIHCESNLRGSTFLLQTSCSGGSRGGCGIHPPPDRPTGNTLTVVKKWIRAYGVCHHNRHRAREPHFWHFLTPTSLCCLLVNTICCPRSTPHFRPGDAPVCIG